MPGGDGTGPMGMGPMTGRAAGYCAGYPVPGYMNPVPGRGWGRGFGWGRGWYGRPWAYGPAAPPAYGATPYGWPQPSPEQEAQMLRQQADALGQQLEAIRKRIEELEAQPAED